MYTLLKTIEPSSSTRTMRFPRIDYIRKRVEVAHSTILNHYRGRLASVNSKHNIVLLSILLHNRFISSSYSLKDPDIRTFLEDVCNEAATLYGFHTKFKDGTLLQNVFFKDADEYIYLDYDNVNLVNLLDNWDNIDIVKHKAHSSKDFSLIPHGPNRLVNGGITSSTINVYNLLVSLVKFYEYNATLDDPLTIPQYVASYIMTNDLIGFMDLSLINCIGDKVYSRGSLEFKQIPSVSVPNFMDYMTDSVNVLNGYYHDINIRLNLEDILDQFITISEKSIKNKLCYKFSLNTIYSYKRFWYDFHRIISLLCKYAKSQNDDSRYKNQINDLKRILDRSDSMGVFNGHDKLRDYIKENIELYI